MKKRKLMKYFAGVMITMIMMTGLEGCGPTDGKKKIKDALIQKYQEEFEILTCTNSGFFMGTYQASAYAVNHPELVFSAEMEMKSGKMMDSYVAKRVCDKISDKVMLNLNSLQCDYYVFTEATFPRTLSLDPNIPLEQYIGENKGNEFVIYVVLNKEGADTENIIAAVHHLLDGFPVFQGYISFYLADTEMIGKIQSYVSSHVDTLSDFDEMTEPYYWGSIDLVDGTIPAIEMNIMNMAGGRL